MLLKVVAKLFKYVSFCIETGYLRYFSDIPLPNSNPLKNFLAAPLKAVASINTVSYVIGFAKHHLFTHKILSIFKL